MSEMHPDALFCVSDGWFTGFKVYHSVSFRQPPADKKDLIREFHREIRKTAAVGEFKMMSSSILGVSSSRRSQIWTRSSSLFFL